MEIIQPAHNKKATKVRSWKEIKDQAKELRKFIKDTDGNFKGRYEKCAAISHAQVSEEPMNFFVVNEKHKSFDGKTEKTLKQHFGTWCIINPIITHEELLNRWPEACMSYPHRKERNTERYGRIKVVYYVPFFGRLRKKSKNLEAFPAFVVQHEVQHANGENIYGL